MTDLFVAGAADDTAELHALYSVIAEDDELRPMHKKLVPGQPVSGQMGAEDIIRIILDPATVAAFSMCICAWLNSRRSKLRLIVKEPGNSRQVEIVADGVKAVTAETVQRALEIARGSTDGSAE